jgi:NADH-quinone oxidoreductase subunit L
MTNSLHLVLIPLLPLVGFLLNGIAGRKLPQKAVTGIALAASFLSFAVVANAAFAFKSLALPYIEKCPIPWIVAGNFHVDFSFALDSLTLTMLLVVTGVGFLIHLYSVGYMAHEEGYWRFFAYMNLFLFFMTILVLAENFLLMFVGWEGVGLASYLLIGFYFRKDAAANAGKKAFIVNRIGDFGFLIAMFLLLQHFGSLSFSAVATQLAAQPVWQGGVLTLIALALVLGAAGKSAQIPLYVWLPDAMEGPTPVSALIHAATMVTAGIYMVVRTHAIFDRSAVALTVVSVIGALTALFAATIGLVQHDIKRVLAYSTVSQLGYMFLACGVGAYSAAIFHLVTHAFFKALLFLAAGSVIHALGGEQDLRKMGGLRKKIPVTYWTMTAGVLAIAGIWPFAGFFSKDAILFAALQSGSFGPVLYGAGLLTALLTSFYMFRLWYLAFWGELRSPDVHVHESPWTILLPLSVLAVLSLVGGWIGLERFGAWLGATAGNTGGPVAGTEGLELELSILAMAIALIGWIVADRIYRVRKMSASGFEKSVPFGYRLVEGKYFVDEGYQAVVVSPLLIFSRYGLGVFVEKGLIGGAAQLLSGAANFSGAILRTLQSGNLRSYAGWLTAGAVAVLLVVLHGQLHSLILQLY